MAGTHSQICTKLSSYTVWLQHRLERNDRIKWHTRLQSIGGIGCIGAVTGIADKSIFFNLRPLEIHSETLSSRDNTLGIDDL